MTFKMSVEHEVSLGEAMAAADAIERAVGEICNGQRKAGSIPTQELCALVQFVRDEAARRASGAAAAARAAMAEVVSESGGLTHEEKIRRVLRPGDTVTHTRCMGCVEEHVFTEYGAGKAVRWLCGSPTKDTIRLGGPTYEAADIAFCNVTHINRVPVDVCEYAAEFADRLKAPAG